MNKAIATFTIKKPAELIREPNDDKDRTILSNLAFCVSQTPLRLAAGKKEFLAVYVVRSHMSDADLREIGNVLVAKAYEGFNNNVAESQCSMKVEAIGSATGVTIIVGFDNEDIEFCLAPVVFVNVLRFPESALHPARHMGAVVQRIDDAIRTKKQLIIATHSEAIINGIGDRIESGLWPHDAFKIVVAGYEPRVAGYDRDGSLNTDWPFGFFAPVED